MSTKETFLAKNRRPLFSYFAFLCVSVSQAVAGGISSPAFAQAPEVGGLLPSGGPRGQAVQVRLDGKNLKDAKLHLNGSGVTIKSAQVNPEGTQLTAELIVAPDARLGPREVRLATPKGISNGSRFWVDITPNKTLEQPMQEGMPPIELEGKSPVVINGRIANATGRDRFAITATAGETWAFDCFAQRIHSRFDPVLELRDETGVSVRLVQSTWESDPRFTHRFEKAGRYFLIVRDSEYKGGPNFTYRLFAGKVPFVSSFSPRGERPGHQVSLALNGTDLTSPRASVAIPADAKPGIYWTEVPAPAGSPVLIPLVVDSDPVFDAGDGDAVRPISAIPIAIDGVFGRSSRARFSFRAAAKQKYLLDLLGRRLGSRIDGEVRVLDSTGKEIATNDDGLPLSKDARLEFEAPTEGQYTVEVRNVEEMTGPDCFYRLKIRQIEPDFNLKIETDRLAVPQAGTITLPITVERTGGYSGPVEIRVDNLPAGVTSTGGIIPPNRTTVDITLTAAPETVYSASDIQILGTANISNKSVVHDAPGWERYEHRSIDLLLSVEYSYTRPFYLWDMLLLGVTERNTPITVTPNLALTTLKPGGTVEIPIRIQRQPDAKGEIKLELRNLPAKVTATAPPIPANQSEGKITLTAAADAPADISNVIIQATHDKATALAPAIRVTIQKN